MAQNLYRMNSIACGVYQGEKKTDADSSKADHLAKRKKELEEKKTKNLQVNFDWEEKEELGKGSFGTVVLGINKQTGQHMAVKKLLLGKKKLATEETKREIKLLSELDDNKYVVKLIGFKQNDTTMFVFMEYVEQGSLETQIKKFGVIDEELVSKYTYQILMGLAHLHANGVVHGDLKCKSMRLKRCKHTS
jgi:serine/threonine protein kinase